MNLMFDTSIHLYFDSCRVGGWMDCLVCRLVGFGQAGRYVRT